MLRARFERNDSSTFATKARRLFESGASHQAMKLTMGVLAASSGAFMFTSPAMAACTIVGGDLICDATAPNPETADSNLLGTGDNNLIFQAGHIRTGTLAVTNNTGTHIGIFVDPTAVFATANGDAVTLNSGNGIINSSTGSGSGINGTVQSTNGIGLVINQTGNGGISITQGITSLISGSTLGAQFTNSGSGSTVLNSSGDIVGNGGAALSVTNTGTGSIGITTSGLVTGTDGIVTSGDGGTVINVDGKIVATNTGVSGTSTTGAVTVNVGATGTIDPLIGVDLSTVSGNLSVNNAGLIEGDQFAIQMTASGAGNLDVDSTGTINSVGGSAVSLNSNGGTIDVDVNCPPSAPMAQI